MEKGGGWGIQYETEGYFGLEWEDYSEDQEPLRFTEETQAEQYIMDMLMEKFNTDMQMHLESSQKAKKATELLARRKAVLEEAGLWNVNGDVMRPQYDIIIFHKPDLDAAKSKWRVVPDEKMNESMVNPVIDGDVFLIDTKPYQVYDGRGYPCMYKKEKPVPAPLKDATRWVVRGGVIL